MSFGTACAVKDPWHTDTRSASDALGAARVLNAPLEATAPLHGNCAGISKSTDERGFHTYQRPEGKSGGHGVGWSEVPRYEFKIPDGWEEVPVNVFDLGGTEVSSHHSMGVGSLCGHQLSASCPCRALSIRCSHSRPPAEEASIDNAGTHIAQALRWPVRYHCEFLLTFVADRPAV